MTGGSVLSAKSAVTHGTPFAERVLAWYERHGRKDLPWHRPATPYRVWVSEVMLQQTRVETVRPYFARFIERFPDIRSLAEAPTDDVLAHWAGLGYYARARNLQRAARRIMAEHGGELPDDVDALQALPGIGRSTAGAIQSLARGHRHAILDGNVKRVLARHAGIDGWPGRSPVQRQLWAEAETRTPDQRVAAFNQAMMDLGAMVCLRRPLCHTCPVADDCAARLAGRTAELPTPKPKRARPTRETVMLLLARVDEPSVLLERRPARGIWGGLWSLPEFATEAELQGWLASRGLPVETESLPSIEHGFTHFQLLIHPRRVEISREPAAVADDPARAWYRTDRPPGGLPAPIARLLEERG